MGTPITHKRWSFRDDQFCTVLDATMQENHIGMFLKSAVERLPNHFDVPVRATSAGAIRDSPSLNVVSVLKRSDAVSSEIALGSNQPASHRAGWQASSGHSSDAEYLAERRRQTAFAGVLVRVLVKPPYPS